MTRKHAPRGRHAELTARFHPYPDQVFGSIQRGFFIAGFTMEIAFSELEGLLAGDEWQRCGPGYTDVNDFLRDINLGEDFKLNADRRREMVARIKQLQASASKRAIAKALGTDERTVRRDLDGAANAALAPSEIMELAEERAANAAWGAMMRLLAGDEPSPEKRAEVDRKIAEMANAIVAKVDIDARMANLKVEATRQAVVEAVQVYAEMEAGLALARESSELGAACLVDTARSLVTIRDRCSRTEWLAALQQDQDWDEADADLIERIAALPPAETPWTLVTLSRAAFGLNPLPDGYRPSYWSAE
jgi:hypothetical protein